MFPKKRNNSPQRITPIAPSSNVEQKRAEQVIESARELYKSHRRELIWFIQRVITGAMNSHSYLQFENVNEFSRFLQFVLEFTRIGEWQVIIDLPIKSRSKVCKQWKDTHNALLVGASEQYVSSTKLESGRARLYFLHPEASLKDLNGKRQRYSSNLIKYVCHILAIMIPDVLLASEKEKFV